tara:strand:+ start:156 stop:641 length:486 start_codon:yes stop_codon:yes gene_type:complete
MGYLAQHLKNVVKKTTVTPKKIQSGPIYDIRYKSDTATKTRYLVLALNVYPYTGGADDKLLHCLDMDSLPFRDVKLVLKESDGVKMLDVKGVQYMEINIPDGRENLQFYQKRVSAITRQIKGVYKTLKLNRMSKVELCDYNFTKVVDPATSKKYGIQALRE